MFNHSGFTTYHRAWRGQALRAMAFGIALLVGGSVAAAGAPEVDPSYAAGQLYYMIGTHLMTGVAQTNPNFYAQAEELYLLVYPINPNKTDTDAKTVGDSNYHPLCDPCYHAGLPGEWAYHDHVLVGAPGLGINGTAGANKGPWKIIIMIYDPSISSAADFKPIKDAKDIPAAVASGEFLAFPDGSYEFEPGNVLICPLVAPQA